MAEALMPDYDTSVFARLLKFEPQDDGSAYVYGMVTDSNEDLDKQACDPAWLNEAIPSWYSSFGNIREMHQPRAVGLAKELSIEPDNKFYIGAKVVDPLAVTKCREGVYQGFSIGIKSPIIVQDKRYRGGLIKGGKIVEVSLVDHPANERAKFTLVKGALIEKMQADAAAKAAVDDNLKPGGDKKDDHPEPDGDEPYADQGGTDEDENNDNETIKAALVSNDPEEIAAALTQKIFDFDEAQMSLFIAKCARFAMLRHVDGDGEQDGALRSILKAVYAATVDMVKAHRDLMEDMKDSFKAVSALAESDDEELNAGDPSEGDTMDKEAIAELVKATVAESLAESVGEAVTDSIKKAISEDEFKTLVTAQIKEIITAEPELGKAADVDDAGEETDALVKRVASLEATINEIGSQPAGSTAFLGGALTRPTIDETNDSQRERQKAMYKSLSGHPDAAVRKDAAEKLAALDKE